MSLDEGNVSLKSYTELHKTLVLEVVKREQHRLNYEKLKALNTKSQLELIQSQNAEQQEEIQAFIDSQSIRDETEPSPQPYSLPQIPDVHIDKGLLCTPASSHEDPKPSHLDQGLQGLDIFLRNTLNKGNPLERQKSSRFWESRDMISALGQWKRDYSALYEEYQEYQSMVQGTVESEISAAHEKVTLMEQENGRIRSQLEKEKFDLDSSCRELNREKSSLRCEIRTLREELDETRVKLEEKTSQYESLSRKMDDSSFSRPKGDCQDRAHVALDSRLKASESRNEFLQNEIQGLIEGKGMLHHEIYEMTQRSEEKVEQFNKHIQHLEHFFSEEQKEFEVKYNELKSVIETQQACITDMEETMRSKEEENDVLMSGIQSQMRQMMTEALNTIAGLEEDKAVTTDNQNKIFGELKKVQGQLEDLQKEMQSHQRDSINLCNQALTIVSASPDNETHLASLGFQQTVSKEDNILTPPRSQESRFTTVEDGKLQEEGTLKKLLTAIIHAQEQFRQQRERLHSRIQELEHSLKSVKIQHATEIDNELKKCKLYSHVIRKLQKRLIPTEADTGPLSVSVITTTAGSKIGHTLNGHGDGDCRQPLVNHKDPKDLDQTNSLVNLREKHAYFESILKKFDTCHPSELCYDRSN